MTKLSHLLKIINFVRLFSKADRKPLPGSETFNNPHNNTDNNASVILTFYKGYPRPILPQGIVFDELCTHKYSARK